MKHLFVLLVNVALAMPQPAAVCEGFLDAGMNVARPRFLSVEEGRLFKLPFTLRDAPDVGRFSELTSDLRFPRDGDQNFVFIAEKLKISVLLASSGKEISRADSRARDEMNRHHLFSLSLLTQPFVTWSKQLRGLPVRSKERAFFGGWMGLAGVLGGTVLFVFNNPLFNMDRYLNLALQNDNQIMNELIQMQQDLAAHDYRGHHIARDFLLTEFSWRTGRLEANSSRQVLADTESAYEKIYRFLFRNRGRAKLQVKMDLLADLASQRSVLLVRTRPAN